MELDTGAAISISKATQKGKFPHLKLNNCSITLKTYTDQFMKVTGQLHVQVSYGSQMAPLILVVVAGNGLSLLGQNWLKYLQLDWKQTATARTQHIAWTPYYKSMKLSRET